VSWKNPTPRDRSSAAPAPAARSVLRPGVGKGKFAVERRSPAPALVDLVDLYALITWKLGAETLEQETLPDAAVYLVIDATDARVSGVRRGRSSYVLSGSERAFGVTFRPAGFRPFIESPVAALTDRSVDLSDLIEAGGSLATTIRAARSAGEMAAAADGFLLELGARADANVRAINALVERARSDPAMRFVRQLAALAATSERQLQRRFREYVGVGPKWVIRRARLQDAAGTLAAGVDPSLAELALDLGYVDQAHFTNDFTAQVGVPPAAYVRGDLPDKITGA
jgi:AraC-like DNA-binding protein